MTISVVVGVAILVSELPGRFSLTPVSIQNLFPASFEIQVPRPQMQAEHQIL
jgi:hypothetical protein